MKNKPWYQLLLSSYLQWLILGITVISSISDTVYNLIVIPPVITYLGTVFIILGLCFSYYILPKKPIQWISEDGSITHIKALNFGTWLIAGGLIIALWFPRIFGHVIVPPDSIPASVPPASSAPSPISTYPS